MLPAILAAVCMVCVAATALAAKQTYTATYRYAMGDDETRIEARRKCLAGAKRRALEKAGTFVSSSSTVEDYKLTNDQITEVTAGVMEVDVVDEQTTLEGDSLVITMTIEARMDPEEVRERIDEAVARADERQSDQEARISELERQIEELKREQEREKARETASQPDEEATVDGGTDAGSTGGASETARILGAVLPEIAVRILTGMPAQQRGDVLRRMDPDARDRIQGQLVQERAAQESGGSETQTRSRPDNPYDQRRDQRYDQRRDERQRQQPAFPFPWLLKRQ